MMPMGNQFVPLLSPSKPASASAAARPASQQEHWLAPAPVFTPLAGPTAPAAPEPASLCSASAHAGAPPQISFQREGDLITQIEVRCSCGETIVLDCNYALDPKTPASSGQGTGDK